MSSQAQQSLQAEVDRLKQEIATIKAGNEHGEQISVGKYLLTRLEQLGVTSMFGVPGDFNLGFLDVVEDYPTINWVGNCNELNAAYAADGYARVKASSIGVVATTFGVGELSAMNGIAAAFSEMVPVLHIVGVPSTGQQDAKALLHHSLGDGRYDAYSKAAQQFTISQASLTSSASATTEIDRVLTDCITKARPVYLTLPTNIVFEKVPSSRLSTPLSRSLPPNDPATEQFVLDEIVKLVEGAGRDIVVLVDACTIRHHVRQELKELLDKTGFPVYSTPMGKTAISETHENYGGIYIGSITHPAVKERVESAKLILSIGALKSDFNTGNFTYSIPITSIVELHSHHTRIKYAEYLGIGMKQLLPKLTARLQPFQKGPSEPLVPEYKQIVPKEANEIISHAWLWPRVGEFFKPKDIIVAETGTSSFGILDIRLPDKSVFVSQILWGSIGWTVGSTLGAALAARDLELGRTILFIGDGSLQLTVQELSVMLRSGLKPIVFVINNSGYTVERYLHGKNRKYNDISNWKWTSLLTVLGDLDGKLSRSYTVRTKHELSALLDDKDFANADKMQLVEIIMEKMDAPRALKVQSELSIKTNAYAATAD